MSTGATYSNDQLIRNLRSLYGDAHAATALTKIEACLEKYAETARTNTELQRPALQRLSEKDVLLITYGDTLSDHDVAPLKVLQRFHSEYLTGIFELIHILPFHPFSSDDGFSVIDYFSVRKDLGSWQDIARLAGECRVMADAVINHTSTESDWFKKFLSGDPEFSEFFVEGDPEDDLSAVVRPRTTPLLTRFEDAEGEGRFVWTTFSADQVDLNFKNPDVLVAVIDVLFFLISKGARLLRLDAVTFLWKEAGTTSTNLPETHLLIKVMRQALSALRDDVVIVTETNVPHRENVAYFGDGHDEAHMVYNFALPPLLAHSFIVGNGRHLSDWARQLSTPSDEVCFLNFSASHDGVGVRPVEEILSSIEIQQLVNAAIAAKGLVSSRTLPDGEEHPYELNCTFLDLISRAGEDDSTKVARFVASQSIVLAMPGVPAIYIQSLLGTCNDLQAVARTGRARSINRSQHDYATIVSKLAAKDSLEGSIFSAITDLIKVRREQSAFDPYAPFRVLDLGQQIFAIRRGDPAAGACISCIVNITAEDVTMNIDTTDSGVDLITAEMFAAGEHRLPPYAVRWLKTDSQDPKKQPELT